MYEEPTCCGGLWRQVDKMGIKLYTMQGRVGVCVMFWFVFAAIASVVTISILYIKLDIMINVLLQALLALLVFAAFIFAARAVPQISDEEAENRKRIALEQRKAEIDDGNSTEQACVTYCPWWVAPLAVFIVILIVDGVFLLVPHTMDDIIKISLIAFLCINGMMIVAWLSTMCNKLMVRKVDEDDKLKQNKFGAWCDNFAGCIVISVAVLLFAVGFVLLFVNNVNGDILKWFFLGFLICELILFLVVVILSGTMIGAVNFGIVYLGRSGRTVAHVDDIYRDVSKRKQPINSD